MGKIRKVKPNEIVIFEKEFEFGGKQNAIYMQDDGTLLFLHTDNYYTNGKPRFYNLEVCSDGE